MLLTQIDGESFKQIGLRPEFTSKLANFNKKIEDLKEKSDKRRRTTRRKFILLYNLNDHVIT